MKNPDNKPLRIVPPKWAATGSPWTPQVQDYVHTLEQLSVAESNLVRAGKDSALPHFIAIVKEIERVYGFKFEFVDEP